MGVPYPGGRSPLPSNGPFRKRDVEAGKTANTHDSICASGRRACSLVAQRELRALARNHPTSTPYRFIKP